MKIWLVKAGEALPCDKPKDRLKRMGLLAEELERRDHHITWFNSTFNHSRKEQRCDVDKTINISENYQIQLIHSNSYKNVSLARIKHHVETAKKFKKLAYSIEKPDVIFCSMPTIELAEKAVEYGLEMNIPVIIDIRDLWPDIFAETLPSYAGILIKPYIFYCRKRLSKLLSKAYAITGLTSEFLDWGLSYAKRSITENDKVFNMAYKSEIYKTENPYEEWESLDIDDFIICFFGHLGRQFNLDPVIETARKLQKESGIKFVICGNGESLPKLIKSAEDLDNIFFPGWINHKQIQTLLNIASVGIAPYKKSINFTMNVPNKFGEYLSAGLPVILGVDGAMHRFVKDNNCGYMYKNSQQLVDIILKLKNNSEEKVTMSKNAKNLYSKEFNAVKVYGDLVNYLEDIVEKNKS
ncbi:MAG: glycosyltransferase family 4 protein [Eubacteriales bacterium]